MKEKTLERKIKKSTLNKDYESSKFILLNCYIKQFKKMIKYKGGKINKKWFFHDYLEEVKRLYSSMYGKDIEEIMDVLDSEKYNIKYQISWLIENSYIFNDYKI